ncbi:UpxY family transcription antiterminator [Desulfonema magnum]|uniref:Transcription termination/antitermination family protein n=1 Tax=Desulfonema magnum TaxID=45655 RepID=A0A975GQV6_9BACT|nr:UpxY family transcription antiterminator [Desulfonema magnum]QTA90282.1 Transcription termination/antitermination family protein [Desulfonema magnum]
MTKDTLIRAWYALHTKSRFENVVNERLMGKSIEVFLPKIQVPSKRRDRKKIIQIPLFPGYLFVKTDLNPYEHLEIVKTTGAVSLIGNARGPVAVPSEDIESLKIMVVANKEVITGYQLQEGDRVMVVGGPFSGMTGIFVRYKGINRVVINISALGQFASVEVNEEDIEILPEKTS